MMAMKEFGEMVVGSNNAWETLLKEVLEDELISNDGSKKACFL